MPFQKGNTLSKNRTSKKNLLPYIRERVLNTLNKRLVIDKALADVSTVDLLKFAQSIMPKDVNVAIRPDITYISQCPRPDEAITDQSVSNSLSNNINNSLPNDTDMAINTNDMLSIDTVHDNDIVKAIDKTDETIDET